MVLRHDPKGGSACCGTQYSHAGGSGWGHSEQNYCRCEWRPRGDFQAWVAEREGVTEGRFRVGPWKERVISVGKVEKNQLHDLINTAAC